MGRAGYKLDKKAMIECFRDIAMDGFQGISDNPDKLKIVFHDDEMAKMEAERKLGKPQKERTELDDETENEDPETHTISFHSEEFEPITYSATEPQVKAD